MTKQLPARAQWVLQKIVIPATVVSSSICILTASYWYHERQLDRQLAEASPKKALVVQKQTPTTRRPATKHKQASSTHTSVKQSKPTNSTTQKTQTVTTKSGVKNSATVHETANSKTNDSPANQKQATHDGTQSAKKTQTNVLGGTLAPTKQGQITNTTAESSVIQFGTSPQTANISTPMSSANGGSLTIPSDIDKHTLLELPLTNGVIWAVVQPTQLEANGQLAQASTPTPLYYTPYPSQGTVSLEAGAVTLGEIPTSTASQQLDANWAQTQATEQETNTAETVNSDEQANQIASSSDNPSAGQVTNTASNGTTGTQQNQTNPSPPSNVASVTHIYLFSLERTNAGAVIVLNLQDADGAQSKVVYLFNEATKSIQMLTQLPNDGDQFSWLAVGEDVIYWGIRSVNPDDPSTYSEKQTVYDVSTGRTQQISLGTWTSTAYPHQNQLVFQVKNTTRWQTFTPAKDSIQTKSTPSASR